MLQQYPSRFPAGLMMRNMFIVIYILLLNIQSTLSANVISFCKCACAENITIRALEAAQTCSDCNRAFCIGILDKNCTAIDSLQGEVGKGTSQVTATCFERDSYKDEVIVYLYIIITSGLLFTAIAKPFVEKLWK
ncbi:3403_t:CDS:2, partial [Acaulospora morrowiae]